MSTHTMVTSRLAGAASATGTARHRRRFAGAFADEFHRPLTTDRLVSSIGIGTYLGECDDDEDARYAATIAQALASGINLIDTAINYRCQRSERVIGAALRDAIAAGTIARDEVVVCTKGGYVPLDGNPPPTREAYRAYLARTFFEPGVMSREDVVGGQCLTPGFLTHQIAQSRENLGLDTIDVYYLHNPEQLLDTATHEHFRDVMLAAFTLLEERVSAGEIGCYGCATWAGLRVPPSGRSHLSLLELVELARMAGGDDHHFKVVQAPINLVMTEAIRISTQALGPRTQMPLLEAAIELDVAVTASATLMQAQLTRNLPPQLQASFPGLTSDAQRAIAFVRALPGVTTALVGMKSGAHLEENLRAAR